VPYQIDRPDEPVADALRRIARKELSSAAAAGRAAGTTAAAGVETAANIHTMRKAIKKTRALLRLVRGHADEAAAINARLRDIGRSISASRDAHVLPATAALLAATADAPVAALLSRAAETFARTRTARSSPAAVADAAVQLADLAGGTAGWRIRGKGFSALSGGLEHTLARVRAAASLCTDAPEADHDPEAVHAWRKRVKDHWYHARLLTPIWPALMRPHAVAAGQVGEGLGLHQDIHVLITRLDQTGLTPGEVDGVRAHALAEVARHRSVAETLAARVFADRPSALADRWGTWWQLWRKGQG
jgi:CHAD domain-containing protein